MNQSHCKYPALLRHLSGAPQETLDLAQALVRYARSIEHLEQLSKAIWKNLTVQKKGDFHYFLISGQSTGNCFVVEVAKKEVAHA